MKHQYISVLSQIIIEASHFISMSKCSLNKLLLCGHQADYNTIDIGNNPF